METQRLLTDVTGPSSGAYNKTEKRGIYLRRWMLWIPLVVAASLLYTFDIGGELRYHIALPQNIIPSEYVGLELL
jgi:hypothetical protein